MHDSLPLLQKLAFPSVRRGRLRCLQLNLGYVCNQRCLHCHVNAGPTRTESMSAAVVEEVIAFMHQAHGQGLKSLDLTGGAPELNPYFRDLVVAARELGLEVIDRCNLTVLLEPGQEDTAAFLARHGVRVVASLPCYLGENVDQQRGNGVFVRSIEALKQLNALGYGCSQGRLALDLVYNPQGPDLPPAQQALQDDYQRELASRYGVFFDQLLTLANMPIARFGSRLISNGRFDEYMALLKMSHCDANLGSVMCRDTLSVDYRGRLFDCDFNQMLGLSVALADGDGGLESSATIGDLKAEDLLGRAVNVAGHCYGCTAGQGSSCGGSLQ